MFWALSWREYDAHKELWAQERADFCNANYSTDGVPFIAEDFLGTGNREGRKAAQTIEAYKAKMDQIKLQKAIARAEKEELGDVPSWATDSAKAKVPKDPTEGIPDWALGDYGA